MLLYGFIAAAPNAEQHEGGQGVSLLATLLLAYRRDDPAFAAVVERTFTRIAGERRLAPALQQVVPAPAAHGRDVKICPWARSSRKFSACWVNPNRVGQPGQVQHFQTWQGRLI